MLASCNLRFMWLSLALSNFGAGAPRPAVRYSVQRSRRLAAGVHRGYDATGAYSTFGLRESFDFLKLNRRERSYLMLRN